MAYLIKVHNMITGNESIHGVALTEEKAIQIVKELKNEKAPDGRHFYCAWYDEVTLYA